MRSITGCLLWAAWALTAGAAELRLEPLGTAQAWETAEYRVDNVPTVATPFEPDAIRVEAQVTGPTGTVTRVPGFWYQAYTRELRQGAEQLTAQGAPHWRIRFTPTEAGEHRLRVTVTRPGVPAIAVDATLVAGPKAPGQHGWPRVAEDRRTFATTDGQPLLLAGENICWPGPGGTFDYDRRFAELAAAQQNFVRLWLAPWWAALEHGPGTLTNYRLEAGWQLDQVFAAAEKHGIYLLLCLDHHGMYQPSDPTWGGSNAYWRTNPYSAEQGGPCAVPADFFRLPVAKAAYQKRLRYLIGRYSHSPRLLAWQFFNEIDNIFDRAPVDEATVVTWHVEMARWLRANDPYRHLISTSLTGGVDRPAFWSLPEMEFASYHAYWEPAPARRLAAMAHDFQARYKKPLIVGEFGVSGAAWEAPLDPHLRGFRQHLWGGPLGGSATTSLAWWWDEVHTDGALVLSERLTHFLQRSGWFEGGWTPLTFAGDLQPPTDLEAPDLTRATFASQITLNPFRRLQLTNSFALADSFAAERASEYLSAVLWGTQDPTHQRSLNLTVWSADQGALTLVVKEAVGAASLVIRVDGVEVGKHELAPTTAAGREVRVPLSEGKHRIELSNAGPDRVVLASLRIQGARPTAFKGGWQFRPEPIGLRKGAKAAVYVTAPAAVYPAGALRYGLPTIEGQTITLLDWPEGEFVARWFDPETGASQGESQARAAGGRLEVTLPAFAVDLAGLIEAR